MGFELLQTPGLAGMKLRATLRPCRSSESGHLPFLHGRISSCSMHLGILSARKRGNESTAPPGDGALRPHNGRMGCSRMELLPNGAAPKWSCSQMELGKAGSCLVSTSPQLPGWKTRQWGTHGPDIPCTALFPLASRWVDEGRRGAARLREVRGPSGVRSEGRPGGAQRRGQQRGQRPPWRHGHPLCCGSEQSAGAPSPAQPEQIPPGAW